MHRASDVRGAGRRELAALLRAGHPIEASALDDTEYRGVSLGLPRFVERLTWKTFMKTFHRDPETGVLRGWNVRVVQSGVDAKSVPQLRGGVPRAFGHFHVVEARDHGVPAGADRALLIHYGLGQNPALDPTRFVRDPLVALNPGSVELLLGWTYVALGPFRIGTPSYFTLERQGPLTHRVAPPVPARTP